MTANNTTTADPSPTTVDNAVDKTVDDMVVLGLGLEDTPDNPTRTLPFKLETTEFRPGVEIINDVAEPVTQVFVDDDGRRRLYVSFAMNLGKLAVVAYAGLAAFGFGQVIWSEADEYLRPLVQFVAPGVASAAEGDNGRGPDEANIDADETIEQETPDLDGEGSTEVTPDTASGPSSNDGGSEESTEPPPDLALELTAVDEAAMDVLAVAPTVAPVADVGETSEPLSQSVLEPVVESSAESAAGPAVENMSNGTESAYGDTPASPDQPSDFTGAPEVDSDDAVASVASSTSAAQATPSSEGRSVVAPAADQSSAAPSSSSSTGPDTGTSAPTVPEPSTVAAPAPAAEAVVSSAYVAPETVTAEEAEQLLASPVPPVIVESPSSTETDETVETDEPPSGNVAAGDPQDVDNNQDIEVEAEEEETDDDIDEVDDVDEDDDNEEPGGPGPGDPEDEAPNDGTGPDDRPVDPGPVVTPPIGGPAEPPVVSEPPVDNPGPPVDRPVPPVDRPVPPVDTPVPPVDSPEPPVVVPEPPVAVPDPPVVPEPPVAVPDPPTGPGDSNAGGVVDA